jgi:hypothetical protein
LGSSTADTASIGQLEASLAGVQSLLNNHALLKRLPDGGTKLQMQAAELERRLDAKRTRLRREMSELDNALVQLSIASAPERPTPIASASGNGNANGDTGNSTAMEVARKARATVDPSKAKLASKSLRPVNTMSLNEASQIEHKQTIMAREQVIVSVVQSDELN